MRFSEMKFIAELCQNHNGDKDILMNMCDAAIEGGATHIKIQHIMSKRLTYRPEHEISDDRRVNQQVLCRPYQSEYERLSGLELEESVVKKFIEHCKKNNVVPLTTCFVRQDLDYLRELGFEEIKFASYDLGSIPMLEKGTELFDHIYVSTGAAYESEVMAVKELLKNKEATVLHCVTIYPTDVLQAKLGTIDYLKKYFDKVGYSDHSETARSLVTTKAAIYRGIDAIERHFTILPSNETRDGKVSINKKNLEEIVAFSKLEKEEQLASIKMDPYFDEVLFEGEPNCFPLLNTTELKNRKYYRGRFAAERIVSERTEVKDYIYNWEIA